MGEAIQQYFSSHCGHNRLLACRVGEASHPGPTTHVPKDLRDLRTPQSCWPYSVGFNVYHIMGDGQCLYSALGYHLGMNSTQTRTHLYTHSPAIRAQMSEMDPTGHLYLDSRDNSREPSKSLWPLLSGKWKSGCTPRTTRPRPSGHPSVFGTSGTTTLHVALPSLTIMMS